jgi:hypothetical protein
LENCKIPPFLHNASAIYSDVFGRYSNTLLASLNNRISIREAAATNEVSIKSTAITFTVPPLSEEGMDTKP